MIIIIVFALLSWLVFKLDDDDSIWMASITFFIGVVAVFFIGMGWQGTTDETLGLRTNPALSVVNDTIKCVFVADGRQYAIDLDKTNIIPGKPRVIIHRYVNAPLWWSPFPSGNRGHEHDIYTVAIDTTSAAS